MENQKHSNKRFIWGSVIALLFFCLAVFILPFILEKSYGAPPEITSTPPIVAATTSEPVFVVKHLPTPEPMKAIYMTACVASGSSWREDLAKFIEDSELNSLVIDIKDYSGDVSFEKGSGCYIKDLKEFIGELHDKGIYTIGRITVFQDPKYTKSHPDLAVRSKSTGGLWKDNKGLSFIDVGAREYWDYVVKLAKTSYELGFDEINFDYIRYPSDGTMSDAEYTWTVASSTKAEMLESFFTYLHSGLTGVPVKTSADLFGLTTLASDDMGIGQVLERALPYFDYIDPMVYPSHFAYDTGGFGDPATHPYEIVKYSMTNAVTREQTLNIKNGLATSTASKLRPWLQDFDLGADYGVPEVQAQLKATYDSGLTNWLMWDAGNHYTRDAYLPEE